MLSLMLFLLFLTGFLVISRISPRFSLTERIGFAFPIGLALVTLLMMLMDWAGVALTAGSLTVVTVVLFAAAAVAVIPQKGAFVKGLKPEWDFSWFNLLWLFLLCVAVYVEYANWEKCLFFPVYDRDSMAGFDTIGYVAAQEHTYKGMSIFAGDYMPLIHRAASCISYLPMIQLAYAYVYSFGAETSKIVPGLFYLSFLIGFYGLAVRRTSHTAAMLATLGVLFTPEMISFSSLSMTNVMQACVASTGLLYVTLWYGKGEQRDLQLGTVLLAVSCWCRAEGLVFALAAGVLVLIKIICDRHNAGANEANANAGVKIYINILYPVLAIVPIILFSLYAKASGLTSVSALITHPFWDGAKAGTIWDGAWALLGNTQYYGWTFLFLLLAVIANLYLMIKRRDNVHVLLAFVLSVFFYFLVLYHVDYKWDSIQNVLNYSAKRFMFCFVPIAWYYVVTTGVVRFCFDWIEKTCGLRKPA